MNEDQSKPRGQQTWPDYDAARQQKEVLEWVVNNPLDEAARRSAVDIFNNMSSEMSTRNPDNSQWYVGIATDPIDRLFNEHGLNNQDIYVVRKCESDLISRFVEKIFTSAHGCRGGGGGGDENTKYVYAYIIRPHTQQ